MKSLILLRGCPGAGKSTLAEILSENGTYPVLSADMYFEDESGNYVWNASKIKDAHAWCKHQVQGLMLDSNCDRFKSIQIASDSGYCSDWYKCENCTKIIVANTFTQEWEMNDYIDLAKQYNYTIFTVIVENRHESTNIHSVPDETIEKMKNRFEIKL